MVDLVHEKDIPLVEIGQHGYQVAGLFDGRAGGNAHIDAHFIGDHRRQRGFAKARGAVEQHMIQGLPPHLGGVDEDLQIALGLFLTDILRQGPGAQRALRLVFRQTDRGGQHFAGIFGKVDTHLILFLMQGRGLPLP